MFQDMRLHCVDEGKSEIRTFRCHIAQRPRVSCEVVGAILQNLAFIKLFGKAKIKNFDITESAVVRKSQLKEENDTL